MLSATSVLRIRESDSESRIWGPGSWIRDRGSRVLQTRSWISTVIESCILLSFRLWLRVGVRAQHHAFGDKHAQHQRTWPRIVDLGSWIQDLGPWIQGSASRILDFNFYWIMYFVISSTVTRCRGRGSKSCFWLQASPSRTWSRILDPGSWILERGP